MSAFIRYVNGTEFGYLKDYCHFIKATKPRGEEEANPQLSGRRKREGACRCALTSFNSRAFMAIHVHHSNAKSDGHLRQEDRTQWLVRNKAEVTENRRMT